MFYEKDDYGCIVGILFFLFIGVKTQEAFFTGMNGFLFWILYISCLYILVYVIVLVSKLLTRIAKLKEEYKIRNTLCMHGIKGGETLNKCEACREEKIKKQEQSEKARIEQEKKDIIKRNVITLRNQEIKRFTEINLKNKNFLYNLEPNQFEDVIAEMYKKLGYEVKQTPYSNDRGKDIILKKNNTKYLVECKRYGFENTIGREILQKFFAAIIEEKAEKGFVVTTSDFKSTAIKYAQDIGKIELINGSRLVLMMRDLYPENFDSNIVKIMCEKCGEVVNFSFNESVNNKQCKNGHIVSYDFDKEILSPEYLTHNKYCVKCGKPMKLVSYRYKKFWGCSDYPRCKSYQKFIE